MSGLFKRLLGAAALVATTFTALPAVAGPYTGLYIFGDSLSDTANLNILTGGAFPNRADGPYAGGRFSDGPLWVETLATRLGVANDANSFQQGGKNFAFAGARSGVGVAGDPPGLLAQLGGIYTVAAADPGALYIMVAGGNDMRDARTKFGGDTDADKKGRQDAADQSARDLVTGLNILAAKGAKNVLIANLPSLGGTPEAVLLGKVAASTDATDRFNAKIGGVGLAGQALGLRMFTLDFAGISADVVSDALTNNGQRFGITNVTSSCAGFRFSTGTACSASLFSDILHPSAAAHAIVGNAAFALVPEPGSIALVGLALAGLVAVRRRAA
jgi:outer membrane lipase/esterase